MAYSVEAVTSPGPKIPMLYISSYGDKGTTADARKLRPVLTVSFARSADDGLTSVRLESGEVVYSTDTAVGEVGVVVYPWDVSIGRVHADDSAMNLVRGEIGSIVHLGHRARVQVGPLTAEVTSASVERLGLSPGGSVVASFKATGTRLVPLAGN